jgi:hypothetical protein
MTADISPRCDDPATPIRAGRAGLGPVPGGSSASAIGRYVQFDIFIGWTMKDGKIAEHQCLFDTAGVLIQQGDLADKAA